MKPIFFALMGSLTLFTLFGFAYLRFEASDNPPAQFNGYITVSGHGASTQTEIKVFKGGQQMPGQKVVWNEESGWYTYDGDDDDFPTS